MTSTETIKLECAEAGMILSANLLGNRNEILLPAGTVLTEKALSSLQRYQVSAITIIKSNPDIDQEALLQREKKLERINKLFEANENAYPNQELKKYILHFYTGCKHEQA